MLKLDACSTYHDGYLADSLNDIYMNSTSWKTH